jgi:hypothetical protein
MGSLDNIKKAWPLLREGLKYVPAAKEAFDAVKEPVGNAVKGQNDRIRAQRAAYLEAETLLEGSVLKIMKQGHPRWVVYSGDEPIAVYPSAESDDLEKLVARADLSRRETPKQRRERQVRARARAAAARVPRPARRRGPT